MLQSAQPSMLAHVRTDCSLWKSRESVAIRLCRCRGTRGGLDRRLGANEARGRGDRRRQPRDAHGLGEQIALTLGAACAAKELPLRLGLDAFGEQRHAETIAERQHGTDDRGGGASSGSRFTKDWSSLSLSNGNACKVASDE